MPCRSKRRISTFGFNNHEQLFHNQCPIIRDLTSFFRINLRAFRLTYPQSAKHHYYCYYLIYLDIRTVRVDCMAQENFERRRGTRPGGFWMERSCS